MSDLDYFAALHEELKEELARTKAEVESLKKSIEERDAIIESQLCAGCEHKNLRDEVERLKGAVIGSSLTVFSNSEKTIDKLMELGRVTVKALQVRRVPEQWPAFNALIARWKRALGDE